MFDKEKFSLELEIERDRCLLYKSYQLSNYKSTKQEKARSFNKGPAARPCDKN